MNPFGRPRRSRNLRRSCNPTYRSWLDMIRRCADPSRPEFKHYGGRGIRVCARWSESFDAFVEDMGEKPQGGTIERNDNNGDYCPENCRWATYAEQNLNRRNTVLLEVNGEVKPLLTWARLKGLTPYSLRNRLKAGWDPVRAVSQPSQRPRREKQA